jgi:hypothetical protein
MPWVKRRLFISSADPGPTAANASSISSASFDFGLTSAPLASEAPEMDCPVTASGKLRERTTIQLNWLNWSMMRLRNDLTFLQCSGTPRGSRHTCPGQPLGLAYALALGFD